MAANTWDTSRGAAPACTGRASVYLLIPIEITVILHCSKSWGPERDQCGSSPIELEHTAGCQCDRSKGHNCQQQRRTIVGSDRVGASPWASSFQSWVNGGMADGSQPMYLQKFWEKEQPEISRFRRAVADLAGVCILDLLPLQVHPRDGRSF